MNCFVPCAVYPFHPLRREIHDKKQTHLLLRSNSPENGARGRGCLLVVRVPAAPFRASWRAVLLALVQGIPRKTKTYGKSARSSGIERPAAIDSTIMPTVTRIPRTQGLPPIGSGFTVIRSNDCMASGYCGCKTSGGEVPPHRRRQSLRLERLAQRIRRSGQTGLELIHQLAGH